MGSTKFVVDKGQDFVIEENDRSFGGRRTTLLRLNAGALDLLATGGYLVRGVPTGSLSAGGGTTGPGSNGLSLVSDRGDVFVDSDEQWGREWVADLSSLPTNLKCRVSGLVGGSCTFRVRLGGTSGRCDGTVIATMEVGAGGWPTAVSVVTGAKFANPGGFRLIKLTGAGMASIRSAAILLQADS